MATVEMEKRTLEQPEHRHESANALWFKDAIIYQLHARAFQDSNNDGIGDFRGLVSKLDYIQDLGVTAIWLQPFFTSPLKDDGYDISDYRNVNPQYGTLDDFRRFLDEAHRRELRVITELVMNHTSDQHEWFQRSRHAPPGSDWRNWYVWSDTPDKYQEARVIFQDFESSNWSWDPVAGAYFWHRFYSHQPDLNFDNPAVGEAMIDVLDFWLQMGVDGIRLDAVPYLYEREGTNCENLPETHAFLRRLRSHVDEMYEDKMLLAEANQWPEDAAAYFGDGDECHMNFHFPLMPRMFMAVEREDRSPIVDILAQTPILPPTCQWAVFLRNHDELTLEMVTDEERDYMYRTFTLDAKARINLGIRRRLAPLMSNDRRKIELMNSLLLSLPGTPILYYGDEIGMGDNYYLGDRNGVRTPMQWTADRNAGFSRANPQSLYLPVIIDPEYHYEFRNAEVQHANPSSLLWWTRRILDVRKQCPAFGNGSFEALSPHNSKVLAFLRETDEELLLIVANLSRLSQHVELDLSRYRGKTPIELLGHTPFPTIDESPYRLSFGPYAFYWFRLVGPGDTEAANDQRQLRTVHVRQKVEELFTSRGRKVLNEALVPYFRQQRWFAGKARQVRTIEVIDWFALDTDADEDVYLLLVRANFAEGEPDLYSIPLVLTNETSAELADHPWKAILKMRRQGNDDDQYLCEATWQPGFWNGLLEKISQRGQIAGQLGAVTGMQTTAFDQLWDDNILDSNPVVHGGEQSNTSALFDDRLILKLFRRLTPGVNPDLEIGRQLTDHPNLSVAPKVAGALSYAGERNSQFTIGVLHQFVPNVGDAWTYTLDELGRYLERVQSADLCEIDPSSSPNNGLFEQVTIDVQRSVLDLAGVDPPPLAQHVIGGFLSLAELLGQRTGELHVGLATAGSGSAFAPEPFTRLYQRSLYQSMSSQARSTINMLRSLKPQLSEEAQGQADEFLQCEQSLYSKFADLTRHLIDARRIRCHGDLHLGQVLFTGSDFVFIDFEGEPERPVSERRIKSSALRDVAGMLRSFHYAAHAAVRGQTKSPIVQHASVPIGEWANYWSAWVSAAFLRTYLLAAEPGNFLPKDRAELQTLLRAYLLEKALYELRYELNNRPSWVNIPLDGIRQYCTSPTKNVL